MAAVCSPRVAIADKSDCSNFDALLLRSFSPVIIVRSTDPCSGRVDDKLIGEQNEMEF